LKENLKKKAKGVSKKAKKSVFLFVWRENKEGTEKLGRRK
jgi:hypothetical protein